VGLLLFKVDAFTSEAFAGNPAAVCILAESRDEKWMQNLAREMNLSETAFLVAQKDGFDLRWFTPSVEVALCGHATLASAHVLWETGLLEADEEARFHTKSGLLTAERKEGWIELNFPATPDQPIPAPPQLLEALGVSSKYTGKTKFDYLVEAESEKAVRDVTPNFGLLRAMNVRGVMVTSRAGTAKYDFVSRFFAPGSGIDEDPVTGSAHCCLGPFWSKRLGRNELVAYQASKRGGIIRVRVADERVYLSGQAVTILRGELADSL
jgi:PhzF family phenazine biosynthesis protein